ncbi:UNVERIFIED_ORG: hypothetical protein J2W19_003118 [Shinella zoogloeoides]|nr:hypothetical protein [Shinella zoogloeoides]
MSTERILIHGTTAQRMAATPALGQIGSDDDLGTVVLGDGVTPGGIVMARADQIVLPGLLFGLTMSNNLADMTNDIDIAPGWAAAIDNGRVMRLAAAITKRLDAIFAPGTNAGMLDVGAKANSTWYHVFAIGGHGTLPNDVLCSTSPVTPVMPSGFALKRRIGSIFVDAAGVIKPFLQVGGNFYWHSPVVDANLTAMTLNTPLLVTISTPLGIKTRATIAPFPRVASGTAYLAIRDPDMAGNMSTDWSVIYVPSSASGVLSAGALMEVWTNSISRLQFFTSSSGVTLLLFTRGWYDPRDSFL